MNKREARITQRRKDRKQQQIILLGAILFGGLLIVTALAMPSIMAAWEPVGEYVTPVLITKPMAIGNAMGDPKAPVKVEEFSDFQCPFCVQFHFMTEPQLISEYIAKGKVYFVYIPLYFLGPESKTAAQAAFCARDQDKFWEYKDFLFANHTGENVGDFKKKRLQAFGQDIGLDMAAFNGCLDSGKPDNALNEGKLYADKNRVNSTPSFLVNGKLYGGDTVMQAIASELSKK